jgi:hypothetical protein
MIFNLLTAVLIVLKLLGFITISWFLVFLPTVIMLLLLLILVFFS